jgi:hypothetical protein
LAAVTAAVSVGTGAGFRTAADSKGVADFGVVVDSTEAADFGAVVGFVEEAVAAEAVAGGSGRLVGVAPLPAGDRVRRLFRS